MNERRIPPRRYDTLYGVWFWPEFACRLIIEITIEFGHALYDTALRTAFRPWWARRRRPRNDEVRAFAAVDTPVDMSQRSASVGIGRTKSLTWGKD